MIETCNVCGSKVDKTFSLGFKDLCGLSLADYTQDVAVCPKCQLIFTINPFSEDQLAERYKSFSRYEYDSQSYHLDEADSNKARSIRQKAFLEQTIGLTNIKSILEVGAASGYNLSLYKENFDVYGIEPSVLNCDTAKKRYNVDMFCGTFKEYVNATASNSKSFDLVFLSHVLEHIVNPCDFIKELSAINSRYMFIEVPTLDCKWVDEPYGIFFEEHVSIFTLESLGNLMAKCGYKLINAEIGFNDILLSAGVPQLITIWEKTDVIDADKTYEFNFHAKELLRRYVEKSKSELERIKGIIDSIDGNVNIALWGTGHHASMLLANTSLADKNIVSVYDSDLKKSGMSFNGIKIQQFDEADVLNKGIGAVLVATYAAQEAICKILEDHHIKLKIIKLYDI